MSLYSTLMETYNNIYLALLISHKMYLVTENKKYLDGFLFYFYFYFAPSTQIFLKISRKTFYEKKLALQFQVTQGTIFYQWAKILYGLGPIHFILNILLAQSEQQFCLIHHSIGAVSPGISNIDKEIRGSDSSGPATHCGKSSGNNCYSMPYGQSHPTRCYVRTISVFFPHAPLKMIIQGKN